MLRKLFFGIGLALLSLNTHAQYLDSTFGLYGIDSTSFAGIREQCSSVVIKPNGQVLTGGFIKNVSGTTQFAIAAYDTSGILDNTFGTGGKVMMPNNGINNEMKNMTLQPDGKILAVGMEMTGAFSPWTTLLARFNADGTLDNTFGTGGKVTTAVGSKVDAYCVLVQTDGKILICGTEYGNSFYVVIRYNADGSLDNTFGTGGIAQGTQFGTGMAMALQPDGKIVIAGEFYGNGPHVGISRLNTNGTIDNTFGVNGYTQIESPYAGEYVWGGHDVKILNTGKILVPIYLSSPAHAHEPVIIRLTSAGVLDNTFGTNGYARGSYCNNYEGGEKMAIQPDDKILFTGFIDPQNVNNKDSLFVMRFEGNGTPDNTFGHAGRITALIDTAGSSACSIALQNNNKFLLAGVIGISGMRKNMLLRYTYVPAVPTGITATQKHPDVTVYPDPATDKLYIRSLSKVTALSITDMAGRQVIKITAPAADNAVNISKLQPGTYFISVSCGAEVNTTHFIKQ